MKVQRVLCSWLLAFFCFYLGGSSAVEFVKAAPEPLASDSVDLPKLAETAAPVAPVTTWNLVAILVDENLMDDAKNYDGLAKTAQGKYANDLKAATLQERIQRYARDVEGADDAKDATAFTKTVIVRVKKTESPEEISATLERLYLEGDGTVGEKNQLAGVVIVGDVPLPVVNKNGNRFVSMYPYTDFVDPAYVYNPATDDFELNGAVKNPQVEVWHGLIVPPQKGDAGNGLLAEYFDKNHLYHLKNPDFYGFNKKLFYSDFENEFKLMNKDSMSLYKNYLKYWDDISNLRYNKHWAQILATGATSGLLGNEGDGKDNDGDGKIDEDPVNGYDDDGDGEKGSPLMGIMDGKDNDGDGKIDNDEEGTWGICGDQVVPPTGKVVYQNCKIPGQPYKICPPDGSGKITTGPNCNYYNVKTGSKYFVTDNLDNNNNGKIDEGIDEDPGDAYIGIDNDRDGRIDEDTTTDNNADGDAYTDEDGPGDMNGDGCPGVCGQDEDNDSADDDHDGYPNGYEKEYGTLSLTPLDLVKVIGIVKNTKSLPDLVQNLKQFQTPTDPRDPLSIPLIRLTTPLGLVIYPRFLPFPKASDWVDEGSSQDDDEDGKVNEDGLADNDNDHDGVTDEDPAAGPGAAASSQIQSSFDSIPDIKTQQQIETFLKHYSELFDKFFAQINVWADYTGRYNSNYVNGNGDTKSDVVSFPYLISIKDDFTRIYLKAVNDAVEKRIDDYVVALQANIRLVKGAEISGYMVVDNKILPAAKPLPVHVSFVNGGYKNPIIENQIPQLKGLLDANKDNPDLQALVQKFLDQALKDAAAPVTADTPVYLNGKPIEEISNIEDCTLIRGSIGGENSQAVYANTVYDAKSDLGPTNVPKPSGWENVDPEAITGNDGNNYQGLSYQFYQDPAGPMQVFLAARKAANDAYAGCFNENQQNPGRCFVTRATRNIFSLNGTKEEI